MQCVESAITLRQQIKAWKAKGQTIAFVPTMGNLHQGHLSLVKAASKVADKVVVSIFVNPLQFGVDEDLALYPRTLAVDQNVLENLSVDLLFLPNSETMYAKGTLDVTQVIVPGVSDILCGEFRPTLFSGVTTVVSKLLNLVQPDTLILGEKDFQQVFIIKKMVEDLFMSVEVMSLPTVRETDGLAMSSRNQYLKKTQRQQATVLYQTLKRTKEMAVKANNYSQLESIAEGELVAAGFRVDYVSFRSTETLQPAESSDNTVVLLIAAWLDKTRLIDNLRLS